MSNDVLEGQTSIPRLGRPPAPKFGPDNSEGANPFRAKEHRRKLPFSLPGPLAMMLGPDGGEQLGAVVGAIVDFGADVLSTLRRIEQGQLDTQRELVRVQVMLDDPRDSESAGRSTQVLIALANDDSAWEGPVCSNCYAIKVTGQQCAACADEPEE